MFQISYSDLFFSVGFIDDRWKSRPKRFANVYCCLQFFCNKLVSISALKDLSNMRRVALFSRNALLLKKSGKPTDVKEYKQVYLPYEGDAPTKMEVERERRKFMHCGLLYRDGTRRMLPVTTVPENMFTFGKEGMSIPIAIFKDQKDPVIGPEHTYPGIYENKIAGQPATLNDLYEMEKNTPVNMTDSQIVDQHCAQKMDKRSGASVSRSADGGFASPFQRHVLDKLMEDRLEMIRIRVGLLKLAHTNRYNKERKAAQEFKKKGK